MNPGRFNYYKNLRKRTFLHHETWWLCPETNRPLTNVLLAVGHPDCPRLIDGLQAGAVYEYDYHHLCWIGELCERNTKFQLWWEALKRFSGFSERLEGEQTHPFYELLEFGFSGATFGPVITSKLHTDFMENLDRAVATQNEAFVDTYRLAAHCFSVPGNSGALVLNTKARNQPKRYHPGFDASLVGPVWPEIEDI